MGRGLADHAAANWHRPTNGTYLTKIGHIRDPPKLLGRHVHEFGKDANKGVVDPYVDGSELLFDFSCRTVEGLLVGHVDLDDERLATCLFYFSPSGLEAVCAAGKERNMCALLGKLADGRSTYPRRGPVTTTTFGLFGTSLMRRSLCRSVLPQARLASARSRRRGGAACLESAYRCRSRR